MTSPEREQWLKTMVQEFQNGKTTGELADKYHMSRQGIHNALKSMGISAQSGGRHIKALKKAERKLHDKNLRVHETLMAKNRYGCSLEEWDILKAIHDTTDLTPITDFSHNRSYARRVHIPWELNLWDWWKVWEASGHYENRGRRADEYCMVRKDENLPFEKDNAMIIRNDDHYRNVRRRVAAQNRVESLENSLESS